MISDARIEAALDFLTKTAHEIGQLAEQAKLAEHLVKHVLALEMKKYSDDLPVSAQEREARASNVYREAILADARAAGALQELRARRDAAETTISAWQTYCRQQGGARP